MLEENEGEKGGGGGGAEEETNREKDRGIQINADAETDRVRQFVCWLVA